MDFPGQWNPGREISRQWTIGGNLAPMPFQPNAVHVGIFKWSAVPECTGANAMRPCNTAAKSTVWLFSIGTGSGESEAGEREGVKNWAGRQRGMGKKELPMIPNFAT